MPVRTKSRAWSRLVVEELERRALLTGTSYTVPLDPLLDQFGDQVGTVQGYSDAGGTRVTFGIFDTGASAVTFAAGDQDGFAFFGSPIPIKVVGGAIAGGIGGTIIGDVSEPGTIVADGMHAFNLDGILDPDFGITFGPDSLATPGIQAMVGTEAGSPDLPTITGTPVLNPSPDHPAGWAAMIDWQGASIDFSSLLPGLDLVLTMPDLNFVAPGTAPVVTPGTTTDPIYVPLSSFGGDNHGDPGDDITESYSPLQPDVQLVTATSTVTHQSFLLDTGAQLTVISTALAQSLGLDLAHPETSITVQGVAGSVDVPGFTLNELDLPTTDGGTLAFTNVPVYVLDVAPGIDGLLGTNLFDTAASIVFDPFNPAGSRLGLTFFTDPNRGVDPTDDQLAGLEALLGNSFAGMVAGHNLPGFAVPSVPTDAAPTDLGLSATIVAEAAAVGTAVGTLTTTDADVGDTFTYTLVAGASDTGNGAFMIDGNTLRTNTTFNASIQSTYNIRLRTTDAAGQSFDKAFTLTITQVPTTNLTIDDVSVVEGNGGTKTLTFTVTASPANVSSTVTVDWATANGTATTADGDYVGAGGQLTFLPSETSKTIVITINGDTRNETDETFFVNLSNAVNAQISDSQGVGTITNDDPVPTVSIGDVAHAEGNAGTTAFTFTLSLSAVSGKTVMVDYATADATALAGSDYVANSGTVTFAPGQTTWTVTVLANGDTVYEADQTFFVNLSGASNATIADGQGFGTIQNDDAAPTLSINDVSASEGAGTVTFTVTRTGATEVPVAVNYATADGTATAGGPGTPDYVTAAGTLGFAPSLAATATQTFTVTLSNDAVYEAGEQFFANLSGATGATISDGQGVAAIADDDATPTLSIDDVSVSEAAGTATFTVTLTGPTALSTSVSYATADGTAKSAAGGPGTPDFVATGDSLTFGPSAAASQTLTFTVPIVNDATNEASEPFVVNLSAPSNATIGDGQGVGTITNDDPVPTVSIGDVTHTEGNAGTTAFTFTLFLSAVSGQAVTVDWATADGTATLAASDYVAALGTVTFTAGQTTQTITVLGNGDTAFEADETFFVTLSNPVNVAIADGQGLGTIQNDDDTLTDTTPAQTLTSRVTQDTGPQAIATFRDADPNAATGDFSVRVDWGDSTAADVGATVELVARDGTGTTFRVVGHHAYAATGSYTVQVTVTDGSGPQFSTAATHFTVDRQTQTITFDALAAQTYGVAPLVLTATATSGLPVQFRVTAGPATLTGNTLTVRGAGIVTIEASQDGNAFFSAAAPVSRSFSVSKALLTVTPADRWRLYGQPNPTFTATITGFVNGDTAATAGIAGTALFSTPATPASPVAGSPYPIAVNVAGLSAANYAFTGAQGRLTITAAPLTIKADSKAMTFGGALPALTATYQGFVNGDTDPSLTTPPALSTVPATSLAGRYPITAAGAVAANYAITYVAGTLTISPAAVPFTDVAVNEDAPASVLDLRSHFLGVADPTRLTFTIGAPVGTIGLVRTTLDATTGPLNLFFTANASGTDTISVRATDPNGLSVATTVRVIVKAVNDAPVNHVPRALTVPHLGTLALKSTSAVTLSDVDVGTSSMRVTLAATHGTLRLASTSGLTVTGQGTSVLVATGSLARLNLLLAGLTFKPVASYVGAATITVTTSDLGHTGLGGAKTDIDKIAITVTDRKPIHSTLFAKAMAYTAKMNTTLSVSATGGLRRAFTDQDADPLTIRLVTAPTKGTLTLSSTGAFTYRPLTGFKGKVTFTVRAYDGALFSDVAIVTITVV